MIGIQVHRLARTRYSGSFEAHLSEGETISAPQLVAERRESSGWADRTSEWIEGSPVVAEDMVSVEFWKRAAEPDAQVAGFWRLTVIATSSDGERVVGWIPVTLVG